MRFAVGGTGFAAASAVALGFFLGNRSLAILGALGGVFLAGTTVVFAAAARLGNHQLRRPALALIWTITIVVCVLFVAFGTSIVTSLVWNRPFRFGGSGGPSRRCRIATSAAAEGKCSGSSTASVYAITCANDEDESRSFEIGVVPLPYGATITKYGPVGESPPAVKTIEYSTPSEFKKEVRYILSLSVAVDHLKPHQELHYEVHTCQEPTTKIGLAELD